MYAETITAQALPAREAARPASTLLFGIAIVFAGAIAAGLTHLRLLLQPHSFENAAAICFDAGRRANIYIELRGTLRCEHLPRLNA